MTMTLGQGTMAIYALLLVVGGLVGYLKSGSRPSLVAGVISAALLAYAWYLSRSDETLGYGVGTAVSVLLVVVFGLRLKKTRKFMPSGMLLVLSVAAVALLGYSLAMVAQATNG